MNPSRRNRKVTLQSPVNSRDSTGEPIKTWQDVASVWGEIRSLRVAERLAAAQLQTGVDHVITIPYSSEVAAVDNSWRVIYGTRVFVIVGAVNIDDGNREIEITCSEGLRTE